MSDSVRPHRGQPTRLPCPWDSPGKNTGVGCHFLLQCMKVKSESEVAQSCPTPHDPMDCSLPGSSVHRIFQARVLEWGAIAFSVYDFYEVFNIFGNTFSFETLLKTTSFKKIFLIKKKKRHIFLITTRKLSCGFPLTTGFCFPVSFTG